MSVESPNKTAHLWVFYCRNKKKDKQKRLPWQEAVFNVVDKLGRLSPTGRRFGPKPLSIPLIVQKYREVFNITEDEALSMAKVTMGYPFAFQVMGYLKWREGGNKPLEELLPQFDTYLEDYVYEKIWSELSKKDKEVVAAMCSAPSTKVETIRSRLKMPSNSFSTYRKRLTKKGIVRSPEYGWLSFTLPRFKEFILRQEEVQ